MPSNVLPLHLKQTFPPKFEFLLKLKAMGLNPGYLLKSFLLYVLYSFQQKAFCQSSLRWRVQCIYKLGYPSSKIVDIKPHSNMKLITGNIFSWGEFRRYLLRLDFIVRITLNQNWNRTPRDKETEVPSLSEDKETTGQAQNLINWRDGPKQPIKIRKGKLDRTITIFFL